MSVGGTVRFASMLAGALFLAAPALAANEGGLQQRIESRLARAGLVQRADIRVSVTSGVPRLTGFATSLSDLREAERLARREAPKAVVNLLRVVLEQPRSDRSILEDAESRVLRWPSYGVFDAVGLRVEDGVLRLQGWVDTPRKRSEIEDQLAPIEGLRDVLNDLRVQGFSGFDVQLRREIFDRIYSSPLFDRWAGRSDPPVRVFVARGRVMLAGTVASPLHQALVGQIARGTPAFSVSNHVRVESNDSKEETKGRKQETAS